METQLAKHIEYKDLNGAPEMIEGCDNAIVTYILTEDMKLHKLVTFYDGKLFNFDHIIPGHGWIIRSNYRICLYRNFAYILKNGIFKSCKHLQFWAIWLRNIAGFTPDPGNTHDCRNQSKKY